MAKKKADEKLQEHAQAKSLLGVAAVPPQYGKLKWAGLFPFASYLTLLLSAHLDFPIAKRHTMSECHSVPPVLSGSCRGNTASSSRVSAPSAAML